MSTKETLLQHVSALRANAAIIIATYNEKSKACETKEERKKLRKETRIGRVKRVQKHAIAIQELLNACSSCETLSSETKRFVLDLSLEAKERESFIICKDDDIMSLVMRYDNFSMKKVLAYCDKHAIKFDKQTKAFDFSNAVDVLDTIDDSDDDSEE